jgi:hypothetical protein
MVQQTICTHCGGDGIMDAPDFLPCDVCKGSGRIPPSVTCTTCNGIGFLGNSICNVCYTTGTTPPSGISGFILKFAHEAMIDAENAVIVASDTLDKCNDILNKCNDIKQVVDEVNGKV